MAEKRKPSTRTRQTKTTKSSAVVAVPQPEAKRRSVLWLWLVPCLLIGLLLVVRMQQTGRPLMVEWPVMPDIGGYAAWVKAKLVPLWHTPGTDADLALPAEISAPEQETSEDIAFEEPTPVPPEEEEALLKTQQQLAAAEEKIQQLQAMVQEKDQALAREISLRGQSLVAQYARLIERALKEGSPFPWELEQLQRITAGEAGEVQALMQQLQALAQGVPGQQQLAQEFTLLAEEIIVLSRQQEAGQGVFATLLKMLHEVITIRKVGLVDGETTEAVLARAEYYLQQGDVAKARTELQALQPEYQPRMALWLEKSAQRQEANRVMVEVRRLAERTPALESAPAAEGAKPEPQAPVVKENVVAP